MRLTEDQVNVFVRHLNNINPDGFNCPVCGSTHWNIGQFVLETREYNDNGFQFSGNVAPYVTLTCPRCSNTVFFNALQIGVISPQPQDSNPETPSNPETNDE